MKKNNKLIVTSKGIKTCKLKKVPVPPVGGDINERE